MATKDVSQTAMLIASLRALSRYEEDSRIQGADYMAEIFLPEDKAKSLQEAHIRPMIKNAIPRGLYEYVIARTKFFDGLFLSGLKQNLPQIVLLGAGYDSRAYRFAEYINSTIVFEADTPATQAAKRGLLHSHGIAIHPNVTFAPVDFEKEGWFQTLCDAGYKSDVQTLFLLEGVSFYLEPESMASLLRVLKTHAPAGSCLSFDYQHRNADDLLIDTGLHDESIKFGIDTKTLEGYLNGFGYSVSEHVDAEEMGKRYLTMSGGERFGQVEPIMNIVTAKIR